MKKKFNRITAFLVVVMLVFGIILSRLVHIQLINGDYYREMAEAMGEKPKTEIAPRGELLDRNGKKLATNKLSFAITYSYPANKKDEDELNKSLIEFINIIYQNNDQSKLIINTFPINYDSITKEFGYSFSSDSKFDVYKKIKNFKDNNDIKTSFDKNFDYSLIENMDNKLKTISKDKINDEIKTFDEKYLADFNPNYDAEEAFYRIAEEYKLVSIDEYGKITYKYSLAKEDTEKLHRVVALRYLLKSAEYRQYKDVYIAKNVSKETVWEIQIKSNTLYGITSQVNPIRYYPYGEVGSAFLGYMGKISNAEAYERLGYDVSEELVGVSGLEYALENREHNEYGIQLRGEPGVSYVKVDKLGRVIEEAANIEPISGDTVVTTIDIDMQAAAEKALDDIMARIRDGGFAERFRAQRGAVVAMDIHTGEILVLASRPGYDPNYFAESGRPQDDEIIKKYLLDNPEELNNDPYDTIPRPMFNYATQGAVIPGSTFKPFTAIVGLEEGVINRNTTVYDDGTYEYAKGAPPIKCWIYGDKGIGHGTVNVVEALKVSCNYFFNEVGNRLGFDRFAEWARKFGLTRDENNRRPSTGIEINESTGSVGTPEEIRKNMAKSVMKDIINTLKSSKYGGYTIEYGTAYYDELFNMLVEGSYDEKKINELGYTNKAAKNYIKSKIELVRKNAINKVDVLNMAMGQGYVALTPVQMAQYLASILNGGTRYKAHLVKRVLNSDGSIKKEIEPEVLSKINLKKENVDMVIEGMGKVTQELGGTARVIYSTYPIKTGGKTGTAQPGSDKIEQYRDNYAWFISFAPLDNPQIVVVTVIYDGGHGNYAAGVAKEIYDVYFKDDLRMQDYLAKKAQAVEGQ
ncbi:penicillin-binding transpeptidase domain-containing protein [Fonticella tunisiensis]|uniref:Penicillin-binding protein 2 n=1 Tax=Fonticella tunisiensis TaxID=1096341 RepID=A0A4R7KPY1_9CLOT|nr:penicillin-binding transpeptidase domain-containing protein [Fonticella tunisiensis]TDT61199.1 penicillin-binding protein 2 [Fonticella tunisiensis]